MKAFLKRQIIYLDLKRELGCTYAIRSVRKVVDNYVANGSTANLCAIDVSKSFDKVNHYALIN